MTNSRFQTDMYHDFARRWLGLQSARANTALSILNGLEPEYAVLAIKLTAARHRMTMVEIRAMVHEKINNHEIEKNVMQFIGFYGAVLCNYRFGIVITA